MTAPSRSTGTHHTTVNPAYATGAALAVSGTDPDGPGEQQEDPTDEQPARGERGTGQAVERARGEHEEERGAHHGEQRRPDPDQVRPAARRVDHEQQAHDADGGAHGGQARGALVVAQPQPGHDGQRRRVLDEQRDAHRDVPHRREVRQLAAGHRHRAEHDDQRQVRRSTLQRPRSWTTATGTRTAPPSSTRTATAAAADHPASISPRPSGPDRPNDVADTSASATPAPARAVFRSCVNVRHGS